MRSWLLSHRKQMCLLLFGVLFCLKEQPFFKRKFGRLVNCSGSNRVFLACSGQWFAERPRVNERWIIWTAAISSDGAAIISHQRRAPDVSQCEIYNRAELPYPTMQCSWPVLPFPVWRMMSKMISLIISCLTLSKVLPPEMITLMWPQRLVNVYR